MNRLIKSFCLASGIVVITLLAQLSAYAWCPTMLIAGDKGGPVATCNLTGEDDDYCYYDCECDGNASACDNLYDQLGLEDA